MLFKIIKNSILRACLQLVRRPLYIFCIIVVPLVTAVFFVTLFDSGVANHVPSAIVDLDHTASSRMLTRNLEALQGVKIDYKLNSYTEAMNYLKEGKILGFFMIPDGFSNKAAAGRQPELTYYINYSYFVPASLLVKGFTTMSVLANGAMVKTTLASVGVPETKIRPSIQPYVSDVHPLNNPWLDYGVYLNNSFVIGVLALMVMLLTAYTINDEIKQKTSPQWLAAAGGSIHIAIFTKLLPQTFLFTIIGWLIQVYFYGFCHYPMNGSIVSMLLAMFLLVVATQSFAVIVSSITPNLRWSLSTCCLTSILAFSICGYSIPVENMYRGVQVYSYLIPMRYYFLIYIDQALNGIGFVYSRYYYAALLAFPLMSLPLLPRLRKALIHPVHVS